MLGISRPRIPQRNLPLFSHNFFIFPRQESQNVAPCSEFLCQSTSMEFLAKYQFDFNTCIREGVSYLSRSQEADALKRVNFQLNDDVSHPLFSNEDVSTAPLASIADALFSERMKLKLDEWNGSLRTNRTECSFRVDNPCGSSQHFQLLTYKGYSALSLSGFTHHQLRLIQRVVKMHFKDLVYINVDNGNGMSNQLLVHLGSDLAKNDLMAEIKNECQEKAVKDIQDGIGFRHVIDLIASEKKLIVGHNCFLDIAHIHNKFLGPLPPTLEEFSSAINGIFPQILDTKILLTSDISLHLRTKKLGTSLSTAFTTLCPTISSRASNIPDLASQPRVNVEVSVDGTRYTEWTSGSKHEAGYDAFMTGCVFAQACYHLGVKFDQSPLLAHHEKLKKHLNLLFISWANNDIVYLASQSHKTVTCNSTKLQFDRMLLIWRYPEKLKTTDIRDHLTKFFGLLSVISVFRIDGSAVLVNFSRSEYVRDFLELRRKMQLSDSVVTVLHPLWELLGGGNTGATDYEGYKEACGLQSSCFLFADQADVAGLEQGATSSGRGCDVEHGSACKFNDLEGPLDVSLP